MEHGLLSFLFEVSQWLYNLLGFLLASYTTLIHSFIGLHKKREKTTRELNSNDKVTDNNKTSYELTQKVIVFEQSFLYLNGSL